MEITINPLEVASELAHIKTKRELGIQGDEMYVEDTEGCLVYTDDVQDVFDEYYDYYYEMLLIFSKS